MRIQFNSHIYNGAMITFATIFLIAYYFTPPVNSVFVALSFITVLLYIYLSFYPHIRLIFSSYSFAALTILLSSLIIHYSPIYISEIILIIIVEIAYGLKYPWFFEFLLFLATLLGLTTPYTVNDYYKILMLSNTVLAIGSIGHLKCYSTIYTTRRSIDIFNIRTPVYKSKEIKIKINGLPTNQWKAILDGTTMETFYSKEVKIDAKYIDLCPIITNQGIFVPSVARVTKNSKVKYILFKGSPTSLVTQFPKCVAVLTASNLPMGIPFTIEVDKEILSSYDHYILIISNETKLVTIREIDIGGLKFLPTDKQVYIEPGKVKDIQFIQKTPIIVKISNLPANEWRAVIDNKDFVIFASKEVSIDANNVVICPAIINGQIYFPHPPRINSSAEVIFRPYTDPISYLVYHFPECVGVLVAVNLPNGVPLKVEVNGQTISSNEQEIAIVTNKLKLVRISEVEYNGRKYVPKQKLIYVQPREVTRIEFEEKPLYSGQQFDPNIFVGSKVYGYEILSYIGEGGNGYVYKATKGNEIYAIKIFKLIQGKSVGSIILKYVVEDIFKESDNLIKLSQNPRIVKIIGVHFDRVALEEIMKGDLQAYIETPPLIIMEYMKGGSVDNLLKDYTFMNSPQWPQIVKEIVKETAEALSYMHNNGYVHLDVKPQNIFLTEKTINIKDKVKLGDLGSAVRIGDKITQLSAAYCPPEQLEYATIGKGADPKMDIYALGMVAYVLLAKRLDNPAIQYINQAIDSYLNNDMNSTLTYINYAKQALSNWVPNLPTNVPTELRTVILRSLSVNPNNRPSADQIIYLLST